MKMSVKEIRTRFHIPDNIARYLSNISGNKEHDLLIHRGNLLKICNRNTDFQRAMKCLKEIMEK